MNEIYTKDYLKIFDNKEVAIEFSSNPAAPGELGIYLSSSDFKSLSSQEIIDSIAEGLLMLFEDNLLTERSREDLN